MSENTGYAIYFIDETGHYHQFSKNGFSNVKNLGKNGKLEDFGTAGNVFYMSEKLENIDAKLLTIKVEPLFYEKIGQKEQYIYGAALIMDICSDNLHNYFLCGGKDAAQKNLHPS